MWKCSDCGEGIDSNYNFCWKCGKRREQHVDVYVGKTQYLTLKDFVSYSAPRPKRYLIYSLGLELASWIVFLLLLNGVYFTIEETRREGLNFASLPMFTIYLGAFVQLRRLSRRYRIDSENVLSKDQRDPVLYLRAFYEEVMPKDIYQDKEKSDEILTSVLNDVGPLVSLGRPEEKMPPLGAVRLYFNNREWRDKVKSLMALSKLVIIQAGYSDGLEWEMKTAKEQLRPEQLIISFLSWRELDRKPRQNEYEIFMMQFQRVFGLPLPARIGSAYFLYFDGKWEPHLVSLTAWKRIIFWISSTPGILWRWVGGRFEPLFGIFFKIEWPVPSIFRKTSITSVREALRPILKIHNIKLPVWKTALYVVIVLMIIAAPVFWVIQQIQIYRTDPVIDPPVQENLINSYGVTTDYTS